MIRIAFTMIGGKAWTGGYNYLLNLVTILAEQRTSDITPVLFFGTDVDPDDAAPFSKITDAQIVMSPLLNQSRKKISLIRSQLLGRDRPVQKLFLEHRIDVVFENAQFYGARLGIPAIAWIPDFQHRGMPHLFSRMALLKRELGFRAQIAAGRSIMLSSEDARRTCETLHPTTVGKTSVVRFAVPPPALMPAPAQARAVADRYGLPPRYFFMPNQFWQHKNHMLVVQALALLKQHGHDVVVAASGKQSDPRLPGHFDSLTAAIAQAGVGPNFRLLGLIPYEDLAPLMCASVALINPSLFEGWSTTVEEARALAVPMLLSNLDVHMEQAEGLARFFDPHDPQSLADALLRAQDEAPDGLRNAAGRTLDQAMLPVRRFADDFHALVSRTIRSTPSEL